jgi:hypothetical protein
MDNATFHKQAEMQIALDAEGLLYFICRHIPPSLIPFKRSGLTLNYFVVKLGAWINRSRATSL